MGPLHWAGKNIFLNFLEVQAPLRWKENNYCRGPQEKFICKNILKSEGPAPLQNFLKSQYPIGKGL